MLLVAVERELGGDGETCCRYVVDDSVYSNKMDEKGFADLTKLPSPEPKSGVSSAAISF